MFTTLNLLRDLYNAALQESRDFYSRFDKSISAYEQMKELKELRLVRPEFSLIHTHLLQDVITRRDRAMQAFFRRKKLGQKPGFPRFKGRWRYRTFTFKDAGKNNGIALITAGKRVRIHGVGNVKVRLHRPMEGKVKQASVTHGGDGHWYVAFVCEVEQPAPLAKTGKEVGIDVGVRNIIAPSDGPPLVNPKFLAAAEEQLKTAQRCVSRRKRGSRRRRKAVVLLAKAHDRVRRRRLDFHHKLAFNLVKIYDVIAVEDLNIKGLAAGMLAKQVHDAAWGQFFLILGHKAESAGRSKIKVNPRGTSQECNVCGATVTKSLSVRVHRCPSCGDVEDRDTNSGKVILKRAGLALRRGRSS